VAHSKNALKIATELNAPLTVPVQTSLMKSLIIFVPHLIALVFMIFFVDLPWFILLFLISLITVSIVYYLRLHLLKNLKKSVISVHQDSTRNWHIVCAHQDNKQPVELQGSSFISPLMLILNFKDINNKRYSVLFMPDSLPEQYFRRLRVRIRVKGLNYESDQ